MSTGTNILTMRLQMKRDEKGAAEVRMREQQKIDDERNEVERLHGVADNYLKANDYRKVRDIYKKIVALRPDDHKALWGICECEKKINEDPENLYLTMSYVEDFVRSADDVSYVKDKLSEVESEYQAELKKQNDLMSSQSKALSASKDDLESLNSGLKGMKSPKVAKRIVGIVTIVLVVIALILARYSLQLEEKIDNTIFFSLIVMACWMGAFVGPFIYFYLRSTNVDDKHDYYMRQIGYMTKVIEADEEKVKMIEAKISTLDQRIEEIREMYETRAAS